MEVIQEKVIIPYSERLITKYKASDGTVYDSETSCVFHEKLLAFRAHPVTKSETHDGFVYPNCEDKASFVYLLCQEDFDFFVENKIDKEHDSVDTDFETYGAGWYLYWYESINDRSDYLYVMNFENHIDIIFSEFKEWQEFMCKKVNLRPIEYMEIHHAKWILEESPYADYEEGVDGESHPRYVCSHCGFEAGFDCDPDGFAGDQVLAKYCGGCNAKMDL